MSIFCENIKKAYEVKGEKPVNALIDISLDIKSGEIYGILGENGAGKTTLVQILSTQLNATSGVASILGFDIKKQKNEIRTNINIINGGESGLYPWLSARQMLEYFGYLYKLPRKRIKNKIIDLLNMVNLNPDLWDRAIMTLSKGQKQRIMIAKGLINDPQVIFLDEPTIGLDIKAVHETRELISSWASNHGKTIILTSHNMGDIENTCDRLCILKDGKIHYEKSLKNLKNEYKNLVNISFLKNWEDIRSFFESLGDCHKIEISNNSVSFTLALHSEKMKHLYDYFSKNSEYLVSFNVQYESLENIYLSIIKSREKN